MSQPPYYPPAVTAEGRTNSPQLTEGYNPFSDHPQQPAFERQGSSESGGLDYGQGIIRHTSPYRPDANSFLQPNRYQLEDSLATSGYIPPRQSTPYSSSSYSLTDTLRDQNQPYDPEHYKGEEEDEFRPLTSRFDEHGQEWEPSFDSIFLVRTSDWCAQRYSYNALLPDSDAFPRPGSANLTRRETSAEASCRLAVMRYHDSPNPNYYRHGVNVNELILVEHLRRKFSSRKVSLDFVKSIQDSTFWSVSLSRMQETSSRNMRCRLRFRMRMKRVESVRHNSP